MLEFQEREEHDAIFNECYQDGYQADIGEREVVAFLREREDFRLPKINNVKRPPIDKNKIPQPSPVGPDSDEYTCDECGRLGPYVDAGHELVCPDCGLVLDGSDTLIPGSDIYDAPPVSFGSHSNARFNYFKERMAQWACKEPKIPNADCKRLLQTRDEAVGTEYEFDEFFPKAEVRRLIITAGLSPKKYTEKWLSIRIMLGAPPHPFPTQQLIERLQDMFLIVLNIWTRNDGVKSGRVSLPSYDYIICQLLLFIGQREYELYSPWFTHKSEVDSPQLAACWAGICRLAGWPILSAQWTHNGVLITKQKTLV